ncbi:MAG: DUF4410 domain-containing protein [Methylococcales bacterium]
MQNSSSFRHCLAVLLTTFVSVAAMGQETKAESPVTTTASVIDCVEVDLFKVSEEKVDGQTERAEKIPEKNLEIIRDALVKRLPKYAKNISSVAFGQGSCPNPSTAAVLNGDILDFRKGNMALRYFVGFGAGSQKVRVRLTLSAKTGGAVIGQEEIADTKWAGAFGGTNTKGLEDFAEKAAKAAGSALKKN